jgi:hypothetical protein
MLPPIEVLPSDSIGGAWVTHCHPCKMHQLFETGTPDINFSRANAFAVHHSTNYHHTYSS